MHTGIAYGPVRVGIEVLESAPHAEAFPEWEVIEEADLEVTTELVVMTLTGELAEGLRVTPQLLPARYRLRAHARGRDANWDMDVSEPSEDYWLQVWPGTGKSSFAQLEKKDLVWSDGDESTAKDSMPDPAADATPPPLRSTSWKPPIRSAI